MRIISGRFRGRVLKSVDAKGIRPTSDKVRGALFNMLAHAAWSSLVFSETLRVADLFCGTGALGFEALSRGAGHVTFIDSSAGSLALARANAALLNVTEHCSFMAREAQHLPQAEKPYDLVFLDPPYHKGLCPPVLERLHSCNWLHKDSLVVTETDKNEKEPAGSGFQLHERRLYGDTAISFLSLAPSPPGMEPT